MAETKQTENPRKAIREARLAKLRVIDGPPQTLKVYAANETMRASLRHAGGARFREKLDQGVEWPNDSFTHRRLREGSISLEPGSGKETKPDPTKNPREQAAANKPKKAEGQPARAPAPAPAQARPPQTPPPATPPTTPPAAA